MGDLAKQVDVNVGHLIREQRKMMGLTQQDLADALGISYQQVQKYEIGTNRVSAGRLYELAQFLKVDISFFFEGLEPTSRDDPMEHSRESLSTMELVRDFSGIDDPSVRSALSGVIKDLAGRSTRRKRGGRES